MINIEFTSENEIKMNVNGDGETIIREFLAFCIYLINQGATKGDLIKYVLDACDIANANGYEIFKEDTDE